MKCRYKLCNTYTSCYFQTCDYHLSQRSARPAFLISNTRRVRYAPLVQAKSFICSIKLHAVKRQKEWSYVPLSLKPGIRRRWVEITGSDRVSPEEGVPVSTDNRGPFGVPGDKINVEAKRIVPSFEARCSIQQIQTFLNVICSFLGNFPASDF